MTLTQLKTKANAKLLDIWDALVIRQEAYHLKHNKYFQLIATAPVVDGVDTVLQIKHPSDERYQTDVQLSYASPIPFQLIVDEWGMHPNHGFSLTAIVELPNGRRFTRSRSLTDTRVRTQDYDQQDEPQPVGAPYYVGAAPTIDTTAWAEIIEETI